MANYVHFNITWHTLVLAAYKYELVAYELQNKYVHHQHRCVLDRILGTLC